MLRFRLQSTGADARSVAAELRRVRLRLKDVSPVAPKLLHLLADAAVRRIREGRVGGPALSPLTQTIRQRRGYGGQPAFVRTGELLDSIGPQDSRRDGGSFGPSVDWDALTLHDGGEAVDRYGRRHRLPARRFLEPEPVDIEDGAELLDGHVLKGENPA